MPFDLHLSGLIRRGTPADLEGLSWFGSQRVYLRDIEALLKHPNGVLLVAELNRFPVGRACLELRPEESLGEIWGLVVMPNLQGLGLGGRLLRAAEDEIRARGLSYSSLTVGKANPDAARLYERSGYRRIGEGRSEGLTTPDGVVVHHPEPVWMMQKHLSAT
jgi:ribosomal protein S18 acetylase RimI-like enzyme